MKPSAVNDDYQGSETQESESKFCLCFDLQRGYKVIGLLEVIVTLW